MKKVVSATDLGGAPFFKNDLREVFNSEIWAAMQAILSPFDTDTEGIIVSGCVITANASNFDITAGIVYLNGEFMRLAAATNQSFTKYIAPATPTSDSRTFADGTTHAVVQTKNAELVGSAPGAGQYVTIATLTGAADRIWRPLINEDHKLRTKIINIGDWDMDASSSSGPISHGITGGVAKIKHISVLIYNDAATAAYPYPYTTISDGLGQLEIAAIGTSSITLHRRTGGFFDDAIFDSTGYNRGIITLLYEP